MTVPAADLPDLPDDSRSARKRRAILEAATTSFLATGFLGTSMDEIASRAAVSKQTVYKHFSDKETLFRQVVTEIVDGISDTNHDQIVNLGQTEDVEADLRGLAREQLERVLQPQILQLRRLVIGESGRFAELGRTFYERGPGRTIEALATTFERLAERGLLQIDDPLRAAQNFNWLIMSVPLNHAMFHGDDAPPTAAEIDGFVENGIGIFLTAYGAHDDLRNPAV